MTLRQGRPQPSPATSGPDHPAFVMCPPAAYSADRPTNVWMEEAPLETRRVDRARALAEFGALHEFVSAHASVFLLSPDPVLSQQVFTASLGFAPAHHAGEVILSHFSDPHRAGETAAGAELFRSLGLRTTAAPARFEGEAEMKHLHGNWYIGGHGERTDPSMHDWLRQHFDMRIISVEQVDPWLLRLDNIVFPLTPEETLVCTEVMTEEEVGAIEAVTGIIDVPVDAAYAGLCGCVRLGDFVLSATSLPGLTTGTEDYEQERAKRALLDTICADRGLEPRLFHLGEFDRSGAVLSSLMLPLSLPPGRMTRRKDA